MKHPINLSSLWIASALAILLLFTGCGKNENSSHQPDQIYKVVRGDFTVVITLNGVLDAVKRYVIKAPSVSSQGLDVIEVVENQTELQKGDLIVAFSDEIYFDELETQSITIEEAEKNLMIFQQDYQMKIADIVGAIKKATDANRVSQETLEKYINEDAPLEKKDLKQAVETARQTVEEERETLRSLQADLLAAAMGDETARLKIEGQVKTSEIRFETVEGQEEKAAYNLRIFKQYTFPQQSRKREQDRVTAEMNLQKELVNAAAHRLQIERKIKTQERLLRSFRQQKEDLLENISMLRVVAPVSGTIAYGDPNPRRRHYEQKEILVGTKMSRSEVIGSIPDVSQLVVNVDIPEVSRSKMDVKMRAEMRIKALPNLHLSGTIDRISDMAIRMVFWDRSSPKVYSTVISLDQNDPSLRPGMSVEVDMISEVITQVLFLPVEALYLKEGSVFCRIKKKVGAEERKVVIGRSSSSFVEILKGLKEGDRILLSREDS